ncbi:hypothetical protein PsAD13_04176 [Pseudovibrio sp. Ad13]|uniref:hypothetical protein n=1 Tax=Pseudovibrio sp. Ad13 TaxID=989396 RepID=UPI0007AEBE4B|nr:hypothetical protein [Pseudovibrio sp. Ad13]KZK81227.1 hypothetical protein PsAD13_04176 [Pseudovibrio sp. Ad13]
MFVTDGADLIDKNIHYRGRGKRREIDQGISFVQDINSLVCSVLITDYKFGVLARKIGWLQNDMDFGASFDIAPFKKICALEKIVFPWEKEEAFVIELAGNILEVKKCTFS